MARIVPLEGRVRKRLVELQRRDGDARVRVRALIILLLISVPFPLDGATT